MRLRARKSHLILVLKAHVAGGTLTARQAAQFELMYRRARNDAEQDQVSAVVHEVTQGWRTGTDAYSRLLRAEKDMDPLAED
jgi:hypothetical protein